MRSAFAMDRYVGILTRLRAVLGVAGGVIGMILCLLLAVGVDPFAGMRRAAEERAQSTRPNAPVTNPRVREEARQAAAERRRDPVRLAAFFAFCLAIAAVSVAEYKSAVRMGRGEQRGFVWGAGVQLVGTLFGMIIFLLSPRAGYGVIFSMLIFLYCIARMSGWGPKPLRDPILPNASLD